MRLTIGQIHDVVSGMTSLEDPEVKLSGDLVLTIAINLNKMRGIAAAYEQARARIMSDLIKNSVNSRNNHEIESEFLEEDKKLRDKEEDVEGAKAIDIKSLDLNNNPKVRPLVVARLMPILTGV